jgi:hypothetical protein
MNPPPAPPPPKSRQTDHKPATTHTKAPPEHHRRGLSLPPCPHHQRRHRHQVERRRTPPPPAPGCGHVRRCVRPAGRSVREKLMGRRRVSAGAVVRVRGRDRPGPGVRPPRAPAPDRQARPGADHVLYGLILSLASHEPERARMAPAWPWAACGSELKVARSGFRVWPGKPGRSGQSTGAKTVSMRPGRCLCSWQALSAARTGGMDDVAVI